MPRTVVMSNPLPLGGLELAILGNPGPKRSKASTRRDATMKKSPTKAGRAKRARRRAPVRARAAASTPAERRRRHRRPHLDIIPVSPKSATGRVNPRRRVKRNPLAFASPQGIAANPAPLAVGVMAVPTGIMVAKIVGRITRKIPGMIDAAGQPTMIGRIVTGISAAAAPVALGVALRKKEPAMSTALMVGGAAAGLWSAWKEAPRLASFAAAGPVGAPRLAGLEGTAEVAAAAKEAAAKDAELRQRLAAATTPDEARAIANEANAAADRAAGVNGLGAEGDQDVAGFLADDDQEVAGLLADAGDGDEMAGDDDTADMAGLSGIVRRLPARLPTQTKFAYANINA